MKKRDAVKEVLLFRLDRLTREMKELMDEIVEFNKEEEEK